MLMEKKMGPKINPWGMPQSSAITTTTHGK